MSNDPDSPQVVAGFLTEMEAGVIVSYLDSVGIEADIWGASAAALAYPEVPRNVQVVVKQADLERAKEALKEIKHTHPTEEPEED